MALKFLSTHAGTGGNSNSVKLFEIRLDSEYVVFRGSEEEAGSARVAGELALCLTEPMSIFGINLTLSGIVHMTYYISSASALSGRRFASKEKTFFQKTWNFRDPGRGKSETLPSDNYSWPFDLVLDGTLPESVEGLKDYYVVYRFKAEICRKRAKDIVVRKPLRIVRTLAPSALELSHAMSVENIWPNKIEYSISTPSKAIVFGSFLQVDFKLIPLLKGLVIGNICTQLKEEQEFQVDPEWNVPALNGGQMREERIIVYDNHMLDPDQEMQIIDEAAEGFQFSRYMELPKSLAKCMQDCNVKGMKIRHKIKFNIQLHNPDGHISELRANLPVSLYISENLPLNENNDLIDQTPQAGRAAVENDMLNSAPPIYGEHQLDQLYSDVDPSGYRTPGVGLSGAATPYAHSQNISSENLPSLDGIASEPGHVSASALQHRLQDLRLGNGALPSTMRDERDLGLNGSLSRTSQTHTNNGYFDNAVDQGETASGRNSLPSSDSTSRRASNDEAQASGTMTPMFHFDHFEDLAKVPSYSTAIKTPVPRSPGSGADLPTYGASVAESRPSIPVPPPSAHVRDSMQNNASYPPHSQRPHALNRNLSQLQDEERRLRVMQLRGRS